MLTTRSARATDFDDYMSSFFVPLDVCLGLFKTHEAELGLPYADLEHNAFAIIEELFHDSTPGSPEASSTLSRPP